MKNEQEIEKHSPFQILIAVNLILLMLLGIDHLPGVEQSPQKLHSIYSTTKHFAGFRNSGGYEIRNIIELQNGELYRIGFAPSKKIAKGQEIILIKSPLFRKVNSLKAKFSNWEQFPVSFASNIYIKLSLIFSLMINLACVRLRLNILYVFLALSSAFLYFFSGAYFFVL